MRIAPFLFFIVISLNVLAQTNVPIKSHVPAKEYYVSVNGNDANDGTKAHPFKTIMAAAGVAMPGDTITVHAGVYREQITPPRGGNSDHERIVYRAAKGERVIITGSELAKGWKKLQNNAWKLILPNTFFGNADPFDELLYGSWYHSKGRPNHTGSVYLNDKRIRETFSLDSVLQPLGNRQPHWYAEADGNGGPVLMNFEWIRPAGGSQITSMDASVKGGDQAICISVAGRWPFGYLKNGSILYFDDVDFNAGTDSLYFQAATLAKGGTVEMRLDSSSGELLGATFVGNTGDWEKFSVFNIKMFRKLSGKHNVCFVIKAPEQKNNGKTTIWAQFPNGIDPNTAQVEISVRPEVFYPKKTGINYITVDGFILENAATNWAPPSAEQPGLIGPHWAKGWIIENNIIRNSRCSGISLGRPTFGHAHHYQKLPPHIYADPNGGQTISQLLDYFQNASWNKEDAGFHIVRNNQIYDCGQAGIVGCSGGAFSCIEGNEIHNICLGETFTGEEMAGIKLHFAIDAVIRDNHIYNTNRGLWLDWGSQGAQIIGNLFHDNNTDQDVFVEVCHGPVLFANNILLSKKSMDIGSEGIAIVHNLIFGEVTGGKDGLARRTFYYKPHQTISLGRALDVGGDWQWYNNILTNNASLKNWNDPKLPIKYDGNVFTKATDKAPDDKKDLLDINFVPDPKLVQKTDGWYLSIDASSDWVRNYKRKLITTKILGKAVIPDQAFTNPDGVLLSLDYDYFNRHRNVENPFPGPVEFRNGGRQEIKVWPKR